MKKYRIHFFVFSIIILLAACGQGQGNVSEKELRNLEKLAGRTDRSTLLEIRSELLVSYEAEVEEEDGKGDETSTTKNEGDLSEKDDSFGKNLEEKDEELSETEKERGKDVRKDSTHYQIMSYEKMSGDADVSDYLSRLRQNTNIRGWNTLEYQGGTVLVVSAGQRNTGGYYLEVRSVREESDGIKVDLIEHKPGPDAIVTMAITNPYIVIEFPDVTPDTDWKVFDATKGEFFPFWSDSTGVYK